MKKNFRVIQINGFRGLFIALFVITCLIAGFVAFPALMTMNAWNYLANTTGSFPVINFTEGVLLWAIIAFSIFLFSNKKFIVSFNSQQELSDEEIKEVVSKIRAQTNSVSSKMINDLYSQKITPSAAKTEEEKEETAITKEEV